MTVNFDLLAPYNNGGTEMSMDWLLNTQVGRATYGRYLHAGGTPFDGVPNPGYTVNPAWAIARAQNYHPGPAGLPEGATAAFIPHAMQAGYDNYFNATAAGQAPIQVGTGGWLTRTGDNSAVYAREGIVIYGLSRTTNLNWLAQKDPLIAAEWKKDFGFDPVALS